MGAETGLSKWHIALGSLGQGGGAVEPRGRWWIPTETPRYIGEIPWGLAGNSLPAMISSARFDPFTNKIDDADTYSLWLEYFLSVRGRRPPHVI